MTDILSTSRASAGSHGTAGRPPLASGFQPARRPDPAANLASLIEAQIIPRLMLAHAQAHAAASATSEGVGRRTLDAFTRLLLTSEAPVLTAYVETLMQGGLTLDRVYLDLLSPAARRLGDDWNDDLISFTDVTIGLSRLQQEVRSLGRSLPADEPGEGARTACFAPVPGEQHTFGLVLLEDHFRRAGWRTRLEVGPAADSASEAVAGEWFDVLGLSASSDAPAEALRAAIAGARAVSLNPALVVLVGGRVFAEEPTLSLRVGADGFAPTAAHALSLADNAVKPRAFA